VLKSFTIGVSFARTPLSELSAKVAGIEALGWAETGRGDPWVTLFRKDVPKSESDPAAEVRQAMGDYWVDEDARAHLVSK
jgi:hypothetical protein